LKSYLYKPIQRLNWRFSKKCFIFDKLSWLFQGIILILSIISNKKKVLQSVSPIGSSGTGKSMSEALILAATNPQYYKRLFFDLRVQYMKSENYKLRTCCVIAFCFCIDIQNNLCAQHVSKLVVFMY
jgi:hypothetical protein